jgi:hypothetical protein
MKLEELPDDFTPEQFMQLDKEALDSLPYTVLKWNCQCKKCSNGTTIRDYGIYPFYFLNRNSKYAARKPEEYWYKIIQGGNYWLCGKHWKFFQRLKKKYDEGFIYHKLCDYYKQRIDFKKIIRSVNQGVEKINV